MIEISYRDKLLEAIGEDLKEPSKTGVESSLDSLKDSLAKIQIPKDIAKSISMAVDSWNAVKQLQVNTTWLDSPPLEPYDPLKPLQPIKYNPHIDKMLTGYEPELWFADDIIKAPMASLERLRDFALEEEEND